MPYLQFLSNDGVTLTFETEEQFSGIGPQPASRIGKAVSQAQATLEEALEPVKRSADAIVKAMRGAFPEPPEELEIEFSVKASVEVNGLCLAKAAGEGAFTVRALWKSR